MTVSTTANSITFLGNGATTTFAFSFPVVAAADINVIYTDANGVITTLAPTAYSVVLNAAVPPNPTQAGGTVTYNPLGVPIALGTKLTIQRALPYTQGTSLNNQGTLLQGAIEQALDYVTMLTQQVFALFSNVVVAPVSDPAGLSYTLPSVAKRANQTLGFDSGGNVTTLAGPASGTISAAMQPVVNAATLALGRTNFGLGAMAVEGIGAGLADDGSGNARVLETVVSEAADQAVVASFHMTQRFMTGAHTYTLPKASTLFTGFGFYVTALTAAVTFAINGADSFGNGAAGTSLIIQPGSWVYVTTDGAGSGTWFVRQNYQGPGLTSLFNLQLNATIAAHALTIALKDRNGNDPSTASPVVITFRDSTIANGDPVTRIVTAANSIVVPNTATLGTTSGNAGRIWVVAFDNAGTITLGVIVCTTATEIFELDESAVQSPTQVAGGSNTAGTFFSATAGIASKSFRILGYVEATEAVAGTWDTAPSKIQLFGPGIKKPGDIIQTNTVLTAAANSGAGQFSNNNTIPTTAGGTQFMSLAITPNFAGNILRITTKMLLTAGAATQCTTALFQDSTANALAATMGTCVAGDDSIAPADLTHQMLAGTTSSTTFKAFAGANGAVTIRLNSNSSSSLYGGVANSRMDIVEYMA
jgi:hypothetical protein